MPVFLSVPHVKPRAVRLVERHNYAVASIPSFLSNLPPAVQEERARRILAEQFAGTPPHTLCILYDAIWPDGSIGDDGGFMLIGPDPDELARECIEHLELE